MKSYFPKVLVFASFLIGCSSHLAAHKFEEYLERVEEKFVAAKSDEEKFELVTQSVNRKVLSQDDVDLDDEEALSANIGPDPFSYTVTEEREEKEKFNFEKTNPLMLAICLGDVRRFELFLSVVDDVNNPLLTAWGYRQPYYLSHMALDPQYSFLKKVPITNRLRIVDLLGKKNADFNKIPGPFTIGIYNNPPLIVSGLDGSRCEFFDALRARSLLYGADPLVTGSSKSLVCINPTLERPLNSFGSDANRLCELAFDQYLKMPSGQRKKARLADSVKEKFEEIKAERLKQLIELSF